MQLCRGEICTGVEGFSIGREEYGERPAARGFHSLDGVHVNIVDVWVLFPVDFDADEMLIHNIGGFFVGKAFSFHDMAPAAGGISDGEENGFIFLPGDFEGFL